MPVPAPLYPAVSSRRAGRSAALGERLPSMAPFGLTLAAPLIDQGRRTAERKEHRVYRVDAARSPPPPVDTAGVPIGNPERVAIGPGHLTARYQVNQRVRLITQQAKDAGNRALAQGRVQRDVPAAELNRARAGHHPRLADGGQHQADSDSTASPALHALGVLHRAIDRRHPLTNKTELISAVGRCRGACSTVASEPSAYVFLPCGKGDRFSPLSRQEPGQPGRLRRPLVQPGQAPPRAAVNRRADLCEPPATGDRGTQNRHTSLRAARIA